MILTRGDLNSSTLSFEAKLDISNACGVNTFTKLNSPDPIILNILNTAPAAGCTVANILSITNTITNMIIAVIALIKNFFKPQNTAFNPNIPLIVSSVALL